MPSTNQFAVERILALLIPLAVVLVFFPVKSVYLIPKVLVLLDITIVLLLFTSVKRSNRIRVDPIVLAALAAFFILGVVSAVFGWGLSRAVTPLVIQASAFALFLLYAKFSEDDNFTNAAAFVFIIAGTLVSLYSVAQFLGYDFFVPLPGPEVTSTMGRRNIVAQALLFSFPLAVGLALEGKSVQRIFALPGVLIIGVGLALTRSRGGWLAVGVGCLIAVTLHGKLTRRSRVIIILILLIFSVSFLAVSDTGRDLVYSIGNMEHGTNQLRLMIWKGTLRLIREHPVLGVGTGGFYLSYPKYRIEGETAAAGAERMTEDPHNDFLRVFSERGFIGAALFSFLLILVVRATIIALRKPDPGIRAWFGVACISSVFVGLVSPNLCNPAEAALFWISAGIIGLGRPIPMRIPRKVFAVIFIILVLLAVPFHRLAIADWHLSKAQRFFRENRLQRVADRTTKAIASWPYQAESYLIRGRAWFAMKRFSRAANDFRKVTELEPNLREGYYNLGVSCLSEGKLDSAEKAFRETLSLDPAYEVGIINCSSVLMRQRRLSEAEALIRKGLVAHPLSVQLWMNLGDILARNHRWAEAKDAFESALSGFKRSKFPEAALPAFMQYGEIRISVGIQDVTGKLVWGWSPWGTLHYHGANDIEINNPSEGFRLDAVGKDLYLELDTPELKLREYRVVRYQIRGIDRYFPLDFNRKRYDAVRARLKRLEEIQAVGGP